MKYQITEDCVSCGTCFSMCRYNAIVVKIASPYIITNDCVGCGKCSEVCPVDAIIPKTESK